jgi:hypothetical protein
MIRVLLIPACALVLLGGCSFRWMQVPAEATIAPVGKDGASDARTGGGTAKQTKSDRTAKDAFHAREKPEPGALVVKTPTLSVGETWAYKTSNDNTVILTITKLTTSEIFVRNTHGKTGVYDRQWNLKTNPSRNEEHVEWKFLPKMQRYNFPMFVGKVWKEEHVEQSRARKVEVLGLAMVLAEEQVTVPGGTFKTLKVFIQHECIAPDGAKNEGYRQSTYWYAPKIKRHVKSKIYTSCEGYMAVGGVELVRHQAK